jgi:tRNA pseudouridine38-40 synthase
MKPPVGQLVDGRFRFRIDLAYDGTDYAGWAQQPDLATVQGELLAALTTIFGASDDDFGMRVAGRTDAGVHAAHQVAHIDLSPEQVARSGRRQDYAHRLSRLLPPAIQVYSFEPAPAGFDARFSPTSRRYRFRIADRAATQNPLRRRDTLWVFRALDADLMQQSSTALIGMHDFGAYCRPREGSTTIRRIIEITVNRRPADDNIIEIELEADAFCHNMVRAITGALIKVGSGDLPPARIKEMLDGAVRTGEFKVVGPEGLSLIAVNYPPDDQLAAQAEQTKNFRTVDEIDEFWQGDIGV